MQFQETKLPWNDLPIRSTGNIYKYLFEQLPDSLVDHLPNSITIFFDPEIQESVVLGFLDRLPRQLIKEFRHREERLALFVKLTLFSETEVNSLLTKHRHIQPWALYYSKNGGLGISEQDIYEENSVYNVIPSLSMPHYGIGWQKTVENNAQKFRTWLVTIPKEGQDWDWELDIGHESAHAAFAPVPLFVQAINHESISLSSDLSIQDLTPVHFAEITSLYSEIAIAAIRGEKRRANRDFAGIQAGKKLYALLNISDQIMPNMGFDKALEACDRVNGVIDVEEENGNESFEIGAAAMRVIPYLSKVVNNLIPPTLKWYQSI